MTSSQVLVYLAELAPAKTRGQIVGIQQWAIDWGILISELSRRRYDDLTVSQRLTIL